MKAIDARQDTAGHGESFAREGIEAVLMYTRFDRASRAMVVDLAKHGIKRGSVYERGYPTSAAYFSAAQGEADAKRALLWAQSVGQPVDTQIFFAVDYDATDDDIRGPILDYFKAAQKACKAAGYYCSVYGSGAVCSYLIRLGYAHAGWLSVSRAWRGYRAFLPHAAIIQGSAMTLEGFDVDTDNVVDSAAVW